MCLVAVSSLTSLMLNLEDRPLLSSPPVSLPLQVAAAALRGLGPRLVEADLSDVIAGRPEAEALAVLSQVKRWASPPRSRPLLMLRARRPRWTSLRRSGGLASHSRPHLLRASAFPPPAPPSPPFLPQLCASLPVSSLQCLDLSDNALGEKGIRAVGATLATLTAIRTLRFQNNGISAQVRTLAHALARAPPSFFLCGPRLLTEAVPLPAPSLATCLVSPFVDRADDRLPPPSTSSSARAAHPPPPPSPRCTSSTT